MPSERWARQQREISETRREADDSTTTTTLTWTYDSLNRLTSETYDAAGAANDFTATYTIDLVGNRLNKALDKDGTADDETMNYVYNNGGDANVTDLVTKLRTLGFSDIEVGGSVRLGWNIWGTK